MISVTETPIMGSDSFLAIMKNRFNGELFVVFPCSKCLQMLKFMFQRHDCLHREKGKKLMNIADVWDIQNSDIVGYQSFRQVETSLVIKGKSKEQIELTGLLGGGLEASAPIKGGVETWSQETLDSVEDNYQSNINDIDD